MPCFISCCILYILGPVFISSDYVLPFQVWIPYEFNKFNYCVVYFIESVRALNSGNISIAIDLLFFSFSMQACHQIELLIHRLHEFPKNVKLIMKSMRNPSRYDVERILFKDIVRHLKIIRL